MRSEKYFMPKLVSTFVCRDLVSDDKFKDSDEVLIVYKFKGNHKATKIKCTYAQYRNLKGLQSVEYCRIVQK